MNTCQWLEYAIITDIVMRYYKVSSSAVELSSIIYMILYPIFVVPVSYVIDKKGLRVACLVGGLGTLLAAVIKVFSARHDLFYVVLIGQGVGSFCQVFLMCLPPKIAAVWFKQNETSTACSLAVYGVQIGFAVGFILPTSIVKNHDLQNVERDFRILCWSLVVFMLPFAAALLFWFPKEPKFAPSLSQVIKRREIFNSAEFFMSFKNLILDKGFLVHTLGFGINVGTVSSIGTFLNQFVLHYFPNSAEDAGRIGMVMIISGMLGILIFGLILDKTHKYKECCMVIFFTTCVCYLAFIYSLKLKSKWVIYVCAAITGLFANAYMPVAYDLAIEMTFPTDETTSSGILNASSQLCGVSGTLLLGRLFASVGVFWAFASQVCILLFGAVITTFVPNRLKRQEALKRNNDRGI